MLCSPRWVLARGRSRAGSCCAGPDGSLSPAPEEPPGCDDLAYSQGAARGLRPGARTHRPLLPGGAPTLWQVLWEDPDPPAAGGEQGEPCPFPRMGQLLTTWPMTPEKDKGLSSSAAGWCHIHVLHHGPLILHLHYPHGHHLVLYLLDHDWVISRIYNAIDLDLPWYPSASWRRCHLPLSPWTSLAPNILP